MYRDARGPEARTYHEVRGVLNTFPLRGESLPGEKMKMMELSIRDIDGTVKTVRIDADCDRALEELVRDADPGLFSRTSADDIVGFREV